MERLGYINYEYQTAAGVDLGPAKGWMFGIDGKKQDITLLSGNNWTLSEPARKLPPWPCVLEGVSLHFFDGTTTPGYPLVGQWAELGIVLDKSTYLSLHSGYSDDSGRIRWSGRIHSHIGFIIMFGANAVPAADTTVCRVAILYTEEVRALT